MCRTLLVGLPFSMPLILRGARAEERAQP